MADTIGMADLRGLDINKLLQGFSDVNNTFIFKSFLTNSTTSAREIRWYMKTSGVLEGPKTSGITKTAIKNAFGTLPPVAEQSATRMSSSVKHFSIESPWFTYADIKDTDPDMMAANVRDLKRAVDNQIDFRILNELSGSAPLSGSAMGTGWDDLTNGNPFLDLLSGSTEIRKQGYDIENTLAIIHPDQYKELMNYFVTVKGASVPAFSSSKVADGVITKISNVRIATSNNATEGQVLMLTPQTTGMWKSFTPMKGVTKEEPGVGVKIRVWEDGEILNTNPYSELLLTGV